MKCLPTVPFVGLLFFLLCFGSTFLPAQTSSNSRAQLTSSVLESRLARLRHGINASEWFAQVYDKRGYTKEHFQSWTTPEDVALMKSMGFDHVRLSVNPQPMMQNHRPDEISA
jgi:aryl-phospho-beta-D-glucosidase BglC (GH1 family)